MIISTGCEELDAEINKALSETSNNASQTSQDKQGAQYAMEGAQQAELDAQQAKAEAESLKAQVEGLKSQVQALVDGMTIPEGALSPNVITATDGQTEYNIDNQAVVMAVTGTGNLVEFTRTDTKITVTDYVANEGDKMFFLVLT